MAGLTANYISPFAQDMGATTRQLGLLAGIPNLTMALTQFAGPLLSERVGSRKALILPVAFMHAIMFLPMLLIPWLAATNQVWWLIAFVTIGTAFDAVSQPAWGSMMADIVPEELRGRFFGGRNRVTGLTALLFSFVAGGVLQLLTGDTRIGYAVVLAGAVASRLVSVYFVAQIYEPRTAAMRQTGHSSLLRIGSGLLSSNVGRFIVLHAAMNFSATVAGPFFSPYMRRDLHFSYITYTIVNAASALSTLLFMTYWGARADRAGNIKIVKLTAFLVPFVPWLWIVSPNVYWILFVQVVAGASWAGFTLSSSIFIFDAVPPENRARYIALYNALMYIGVALGSLTGGVVEPLLPRLLGRNYLSIFAVSGLLRLGVAFLCLRYLKEVRDVPRLSTRALLFDGIRRRRPPTR